VTVLDLELRYPKEVAPRLWEELHRPLKILDQRVEGVQALLNEPPLQPEERHRLVEGGHQSRQDHDLATGWSGAAEKRGGLRVELKQLVLGTPPRFPEIDFRCGPSTIFSNLTSMKYPSRKKL
jgi:hypothetical protein